ncbi:hypothetical protein FRB96_004072 [Tulasnella sp. 330]|nr:hypothetical protein FRB96_004072 [Tulasnella sp. 330]
MTLVSKVIRGRGWSIITIFTEVEVAVKTPPMQTGIPDLASAWRDYMEAKRNTLYSSVMSQISSSRGQEQRGLVALQSKARDNMEQMLQTLDKCFQKPLDPHSINAVLYFDEVHCLVEVGTAAGEGERNAFDTSCAALNSMTCHPVFTLFLSIRINLSRFAPPKKRHQSTRVAQGPELQPPFTELPFDCPWDNSPIISGGQMGLPDVTSEESLIKFGRPLMATLPSNRGSYAFAPEKLTRLGGRIENRSLDDNAQLAVLSIRLVRDCETRREAARLKEAKLVEGYLRVAFSTLAHREYVRSGTPPQPIMAEAAALEMENWTGVDEAASRLSTHLQSGLIGKRHRGELVARLLVLTYNRAILRHYAKKSLTPAFLYI